MYDMRSEVKEFVGETAADARAKAVSFFGIDESEISFRELASSEVSGLGARVLVVAQPTEMVGKIAKAGGGDRSSAVGVAVGIGIRVRRAARGTESRDRHLPNGVGGRDQRPPSPPRGLPAAILARLDSSSSGWSSGSTSAPSRSPRAKRGASSSINWQAWPEELTAADGRATEAIQLLANQAAGRLSDDPKRVVVDAEGDRERREEFLGRMAERAARRAKDTGRSVALDPMNARDRRGIHMALREMDGVATMSVGEGRYRQAVVVPEGADEYEEALNSSPDSSPSAGEE
jgi:hypothetical protein